MKVWCFSLQKGAGLVLAFLMFFALPLGVSINGVAPQAGAGAIRGNTINTPMAHEDTHSDDEALGYYTVVDRYASGEEVVRGTAPLNTPLPPRRAPVGSGHPLSSDLFWFNGKEQIVTNDYDPGDDIGLHMVFNRTSEGVTVNQWETGENAIHIASGDVDGDGSEELLACYPEAGLKVWDDYFHGYQLLHNLPPGSNEYLFRVASGQLDSDQRREIVVFKFDDDGDDTTLLILDDAGGGYAQLAEIDEDWSASKAYSLVLCCGDLDGDGEDEIAVEDMTVDLWVFDGANGNYGLLVHEHLGGIDWGSPRGDVVICDPDGDGEQELVLSRPGHLSVYEYNATGGTMTRIADETGDFHRTALDAGNMNGNGRDDIAMTEIVYPGAGQPMEEMDMRVYELSSDHTTLKVIAFSFDLPGIMIEDTFVIPETAVANIDDDPYDEAVFLAGESPVTYAIASMHVMDDGFHEWNEIGYYEGFSYAPSNPHDLWDWFFPMTSMNADDGMLLEYTGTHNMTCGYPYIMAVMAAPPTIVGVDQNYMSTATKFGKSVTQSYSETNGYSVSAGVTLSYEAEDPFGVFKAEASLTFSCEFEKTHTVTQTIQECRDFVGSWDADYVIFETVCYDNYYYKILNHTNPKFNGQIIALSIPGTLTVYKWTVDYYNSAVEFPKIGNETFNHIPGQAWTYPTPDDVEQFQTKYGQYGFWKTEKMAVGAGWGFNGVELNLGKEHTTEETLTLGVEFEAGFAICGAGLSVSVGVSESWAYAVTVGRETTYRGDVGDIPPAYYPTYRYSFGLFVYNLHRQDCKAAYQVLNYWVQDYLGPDRPPSMGEKIVTTLQANWPWITIAAVAGVIGAILLMRHRRHGQKPSTPTKTRKAKTKKKK